MNDSDTARHGAIHVTRTLRDAGFDAYLVGGCVRDRLLGRPVREYDIATDATPDQVMATFRRTVPVGAQFGVVLVLVREGEYEVATFRAEASYTDGRRPDAVRFVSAREDVLRRDFTINGLLEDPETGEIRDFVGGQQDLRRRLIRAIGDPHERFVEDHLRMLRAVRFSATLGFDIETQTLAAIIAMSDRVAGVSVERIVTELRRTFAEGDPVRGYALLEATGVLPAILPEASDQPSARVHTALGALTQPELPVVLALLLDGQSASEGRSVAERLKLSKADREALVYILGERPTFDEPRSRAATVRFIREPRWPLLADVHRALTIADRRPTEPVDALLRLRESLSPEQMVPPRLLTGADLKRMGLRPGPHFKSLLDALEDAQLEGRVASTEEAEAFIRERA